MEDRRPCCAPPDPYQPAGLVQGLHGGVPGLMRSASLGLPPLICRVRRGPGTSWCSPHQWGCVCWGRREDSVPCATGRMPSPNLRYPPARQCIPPLYGSPVRMTPALPMAIQGGGALPVHGGRRLRGTRLFLHMGCPPCRCLSRRWRAAVPEVHMSDAPLHHSTQAPDAGEPPRPNGLSAAAPLPESRSPGP